MQAEFVGNFGEMIDCLEAQLASCCCIPDSIIITAIGGVIVLLWC